MNEFKERKARNLMKHKTLGNNEDYDALRKALADILPTKDYMDIMIRSDKMFEDHLKRGGN